MKTIGKIMLGFVLMTLIGLSAYAQPKSEILEPKEKKINWAEADTLYTYQFNDATNSWHYFQREIRRFNDSDQAVENFVQAWNANLNKWVNFMKINYSYDKNGNETEEITQKWNPSFNDWVNAKLKSTTYKGRSREEILFQEWKKPTNEWFNIMKYLIKYNDNGKEHSITISLFNGITHIWDNHKRFVMDFERDYSPPSNIITENWNTSVGEWKKEGKYKLHYNYRSDKTEETRFTWNQSLKEFIEGVQINYEYDKKGNLTNFIEKKYDNRNNVWVNFNKYSAIYNEKNYMTEKVEYKWDSSQNQWEEQGRFKFSTDIEM